MHSLHSIFRLRLSFPAEARSDEGKGIQVPPLNFNAHVTLDPLPGPVGRRG